MYRLEMECMEICGFNKRSHVNYQTVDSKMSIMTIAFTITMYVAIARSKFCHTIDERRHDVNFSRLQCSTENQSAIANSDLKKSLTAIEMISTPIEPYRQR
jgi:hypothetical protein